MVEKEIKVNTELIQKETRATVIWNTIASHTTKGYEPNNYEDLMRELVESMAQNPSVLNQFRPGVLEGEVVDVQTEATLIDNTIPSSGSENE
jgi:hypothetical protein